MSHFQLPTYLYFCSFFVCLHCDVVRLCVPAPALRFPMLYLLSTTILKPPGSIHVVFGLYTRKHFCGVMHSVLWRDAPGSAEMLWSCRMTPGKIVWHTHISSPFVLHYKLAYFINQLGWFIFNYSSDCGFFINHRAPFLPLCIFSVYVCVCVHVSPIN